VPPQPALGPPAAGLGAEYDDGGVLRRSLWMLAVLVPLLVLSAAIPTAAEWGHIRAEWGLAFGSARVVSAVVISSGPSLEFSRDCGAWTQINVAWAAPGGAHSGHFSVCNSDASRFAVGRVIQVMVIPGDASVIQGESQALAIAGVVIESVVGAFFLLVLGLVARWALVVCRARARSRTAPWLPGEVRDSYRLSRARGKPVQVLFDPGSAPWPAHRDPPDRECYAEFMVNPRKDRMALERGDRVWLAPTGRSLVRRRRTQPYAIVRTSDRALFWAGGKPLPGGW
jgi:hypothetical protein